MIIFKVSKEGFTDSVYECKSCETITQLKQHISKNYQLDSKLYIDLEILIEKPIRSLGKFNLEPGVLPRTMDRYPFDRFEIDDKTIPMTFHIIEGYQKPIVKKEKRVLKGVYKAPITNMQSGESIDTEPFDINSNDDFPSLKK